MTFATARASYNLTGDGQPERIDGVRVSSSFFRLFGAKVLVGNAFTPDNDLPGRKPSVLLMNGFWNRRFGGDPDVVGKTLTLNGINVTIAGVMASDFAFTNEVMPAVTGIRVALGAERADILHLVTREFAVMVALGLALGLGGAFALTRVLAGMLFGISATDLATFGGIPLVLAGVAFVATLAPLRRAARIEPLVALRYE